LNTEIIWITIWITIWIIIWVIIDVGGGAEDGREKKKRADGIVGRQRLEGGHVVILRLVPTGWSHILIVKAAHDLKFLFRKRQSQYSPYHHTSCTFPNPGTLLIRMLQMPFIGLHTRV
jgi:hypothetical protein